VIGSEPFSQMDDWGKYVLSPRVMLVMVLSRRCWSWHTMSLPSQAGDGTVDVTLATARCRCRVMLVMALPSLAGDVTTKSTLVIAWCCCQVMMVMALSRRLGRGAMSLPSHAGDGTTESCWQCRCQVDVDHSAMSLPSHAGDGAVKATWARCDVIAESC
jgi:hypothetical protein